MITLVVPVVGYLVYRNSRFAAFDTNDTLIFSAIPSKADKLPCITITLVVPVVGYLVYRNSAFAAFDTNDA